MTASSKIYLDYAAATPMDESVIEAMQPLFRDNFYNPSATYTAAQQVHKILEESRRKVAYWLGSQTSEIVFTAGGSEANNLAVHGIMHRYPNANIVLSSIEHDSVLMPARRYEYREVGVGADGLVDLADLAQKIDENTVLVSIMYANNEIGTVEPLRDVSKVIEAKRAERRSLASDHLPLYLHADACQAPNYLDIHVSRLNVDLLTLNGGKIYGPKQSGVLFVKGGITLHPLIDGGGQERGLRSGTENVAGAVGFSTALDIVQNARHEETHRLKILQEQFFKAIEQQLPQAVINGSTKHRLPNNIHLTLPGRDNERLLFGLDQRGIMAAAGSACSASNEEPSHVLRAIGLSDDEARASLRFTMGQATELADIENVLGALSQILQ